MILIVEDDAVHAVAGAAMLEKDGFTVLIVRSGKEALEVIDARSDIDLVLMDISLSPGMDGAEAAAKILERKDLPIVFLASSSEKDILDKTEKIDSYGFVLKDAGEILLITSVKMALKLFDAHRELARKEAAIRESEEKYRSVVEKSHMGIAVIDDNYVFQYANGEFCSLTGYGENEIIGMDFSSLLAEESRLLVISRYLRRQMEAPAPDHYEFLFIRKDGGRRTGELRSRVYHDSAGKRRTLIQVMDITERKRFETSLRESEEKFFKAFENSPLVVTISTIDDGRFIEVNKRFLDTFGYERREVIGKTSAELGLYADIDQRTAIIGELMEKGKVVNSEVDVKTKAGDVLNALGSLEIIELSNKKYLLITMNDITTQKRMELERETAVEALRQSEEKYRLVVENAWESVIIAQDLKLVFVNSAATRIMGYTEEELRTRPFLDFIHPDDHEMVARHHLNRIQGKETPPVYSFRVISKEGSVIWAELNAAIITWNGRPATVNFLRDITENRRAQTALARSETLHRLLTDNSVDMISRHGADGTVLYVTPSCEALTGYPPSEIIGKPAEFLVVPDDVDRAWEAIRSQGAAGTGYKLEHRLPRRDGSIIWVETLGHLVRNVHGEIQEIQCNVRDITERKNTEESLQKLVAQKEVLMKELQHRVKNTLAMISAIINLEKERNDSDAVRAPLESIQNRVMALSNLYTIIYEEGAMEVSLGAYLQTICDSILSGFASHGQITITTRYDEATLDIKRASTLGLILNELLTNACKYAFPDGREGSIQVELARRGKVMTLAVADDGVGLPQSFNAAAFGGFGFQLTEMLAAQMEGSLDFEIVSGTLVRLIFPL